MIFDIEIQRGVSGIYLIRNIVNNKVYIGSSQNVRGRLQDHFNKLKSKKHKSPYLQNSYDKYGEESFKYEFLEKVEITNLTEREQYWCDFYKANNRLYGYNLRIIVDSNRGNKINVTPENRLKISLRMKGKTPKNFKEMQKLGWKAVDFYIENKYIKSYENQRIAAKDLNISHYSVNNMARGNTKFIRKHPTYSFKYSTTEDII